MLKDQTIAIVSVKKETGQEANTPAGYVSNLLHDNVKAGDNIQIAPPCGDFFLDLTEKHERPLVLLSAGVGITPILSILLSVIEETPDRPIIFIHGSLNKGTQAFKEVIDNLASQHPNLKVHYRYSDPIDEAPNDTNTSIGLIDANLIEEMVSDRNADYYFCGPKPFMVNIYHDLLEWGIPASQVHFEFFGPRQELESKVA